MATVYKAYQASLARFVAIKVLPSHFAQDSEFSQRFHREA
jgi:eukaryotic-like serine/threonine-protein kinase